MDPLTESLTLQSHLPPDFLAEALRADVTRGLTATPKSLPPKWFYDERGSVLFEEITRLPEYYPTRAEREILLARAPEIAATTGARTLVELGSGSGEKTRLLIEALRAHGTLDTYVPMDVSPSALLESGRAHVRVTHRPAAKWVIDAGPYSVHVIGTEFDVRWSGAEEVLDVQMHRGKVIVRGPLASGGGLTMEAGQHLVANVKDGDLFLDAVDFPRRREDSPEPKFVEDPALAPSIAAPATAPAHAARARALAVRGAPSPAVPADISWSKLIAQGNFQAVLADAEQRGLAHTFESASAADLTALADAARYVRRNDVARRALLAERDRFSRSAGAREAAFFLGGVSEDESGVGAAKTALEWYERYLAESPGGTYAAQALGRQMILVHKLRGSAAARPIASEYLERFPSGAYAEPAKKLLHD